jgi:YaiO family outer membrane protein
MKKIFLVILVLFTFLSAASDYESQFEAGRKLYYAGNKDEALEIFQEIIKENPDDVDAYLFRGNIFAQLGYYEIAIGDFTHVLLLAPLYLDALISMAKSYYWLGDYENAKLKVLDWISREPENPEAYILAAEVDIASYNFVSARHYLELASKYGADPKKIEELLKKINMPIIKTDWSLGVFYEYLFLNTEAPDWKHFKAFVEHDFKKILVSAEFSRYSRYDLHDNALAIDAYFDVWEKAYMDTRLQFGLSGEFLPVFDMTVELFQAWGTRWEPAIGYRMMNYDSIAAHIPSIAIATYLGEFYIRDKLSFIYSGRSSWQNQFTLRYFIDELNTYLQLMSVIGTDFNAFNNEWTNSTSLAFSGSWAINKNYLLSGVLSWTKDAYNTQRTGGSVGLSYCW